MPASSSHQWPWFGEPANASPAAWSAHRPRLGRSSGGGTSVWPIASGALFCMTPRPLLSGTSRPTEPNSSLPQRPTRSPA
eukprot:5836522-Alexandrium_andersonii.AAC.1